MARSKDEHDESTPHKTRQEGKEAEVDAPTLNVIQFVQIDGGSGTTGPSKRGPKARGAEKAAEGAPKEKAGESRSSRVPDSVHERFIQIGNNFFFPDGAEAFNREQNRLVTRSENAIVIQSMVAIAREESETGIVKVGGTDFFKKEAWFAASLAGLQVEGYRPTEFERERLVRAVVARRGDESPKRTAEAPPERPGGAIPGELITGKLVDHGPAPYRHSPKGTLSYFVRIETERGDRDIWGVDLERAFRHSLSNPGIGDEIGIRAIGKEAVTVQAATRGGSGRESGREALDVHRNQWSVERKEFLEHRQAMAAVFKDSSISAAEGSKRYSGLEDSYRKLEMGQTLADEQYKSPAHRQQFVEHLRAHLAKTIEYGQPLEPVSQRAREEVAQEPRVPDQDYLPTR